MNGIFTRKWFNLILIGASCLALYGCGFHPNNATVTQHTGSALTKTDEELNEEEDVELEVIDKDLYIVEDLNMTEETISLYSVDEGKLYRYKYNMTTRFMDKYGKSSVWASFTTGTVVTIGDLLPASGALSSVQKSKDVWMYEDISKYKIDEERNMMTIDNTNYKLTGNTKVYSDNEKILLSAIGKDDVITVIGRDKEVISVSVTTGHGYIHLSNTSLFDGSMIFIGNKIVSTVYNDEVIEVPEGVYRVTVANNGWGGSAECTVVRNQTTDINLEDLKGEGPSYCLITFLVTVPDTYVYIDGKMVDVTEPQYVQYGSHKLVVKCDGYDSWNKTLVVNSESATITLALESSSDNSQNSQEENQSESESEETENDTNQNTQNTSTNDNKNAESETAGSSIKDDYDYEVDYLSTISDLISNLMN